MRPLLFTVLSLALTGAISPLRSAQYAILVGVGRYPAFAGAHDLDGPRYDVAALKDILVGATDRSRQHRKPVRRGRYEGGNPRGVATPNRRRAFWGSDTVLLCRPWDKRIRSRKLVDLVHDWPEFRRSTPL